MAQELDVIAWLAKAGCPDEPKDVLDALAKARWDGWNFYPVLRKRIEIESATRSQRFWRVQCPYGAGELSRQWWLGINDRKTRDGS